MLITPTLDNHWHVLHQEREGEIEKRKTFRYTWCVRCVLVSLTSCCCLLHIYRKHPSSLGGDLWIIESNHPIAHTHDCGPARLLRTERPWGRHVPNHHSPMASSWCHLMIIIIIIITIIVVVVVVTTRTGSLHPIPQLLLLPLPPAVRLWHAVCGIAPVAWIRRRHSPNHRRIRFIIQNHCHHRCCVSGDVVVVEEEILPWTPNNHHHMRIRKWCSCIIDRCNWRVSIKRWCYYSNSSSSSNNNKNNSGKHHRNRVPDTTTKIYHHHPNRGGPCHHRPIWRIRTRRPDSRIYCTNNNNNFIIITPPSPPRHWHRFEIPPPRRRRRKPPCAWKILSRRHWWGITVRWRRQWIQRVTAAAATVRVVTPLEWPPPPRRHPSRPRENPPHYHPLYHRHCHPPPQYSYAPPRFSSQWPWWCKNNVLYRLVERRRMSHPPPQYRHTTMWIVGPPPRLRCCQKRKRRRNVWRRQNPKVNARYIKCNSRLDYWSVVQICTRQRPKVRPQWRRRVGVHDLLLDWNHRRRRRRRQVHWKKGFLRRTFMPFGGPSRPKLPWTRKSTLPQPLLK